MDRRGHCQVPRSARPASATASDGHVHGFAAGGGGRATGEARQRQPRAAGASGVHRRLGHAVVSRAAAAALLGARHRAHDEDRGGGPVRHQERAAARDRQGEVRAGRELPLSMGAAGMHPPGRPAAQAGDDEGEGHPLPDAGRACARGRADEPRLRQFPGRADRRRARAHGRARGQLPHGVRGQRPGDRRQERAGVPRRGASRRHVRARQRSEDDARGVAVRGRRRSWRVLPAATWPVCGNSRFPT